MIIPIPKDLCELLESPTANFSLLFPRLVSWDDKLKSEGSIEKLKGKFKPNLKILQQIHKNQQKIKSYSPDFFEKEVQLTQPFVSGLGSGHPTETGFILDRNSGSPYIPASSIKGILRSVCEEKDADKLFGKGNSRGEITLLDAFPKNPKLEVDIMNPHSKKETENPIPIKFLIVPKGTVFVFRGIGKIDELFQKAFERGFGAKTNIGYGKFKSR
ncbi:MAG: type III-B CRISPR module RAMP protein Cmr6 [Fibromonadales bacterium]|nr:type III-B CRISPR module RAMP protein Cmr6 [Fibromonadales bacterium]